MKGRVYFDDVDVTSMVLRKGIGDVTAETQDEEGAQTMGSVKLLFSNMDGYFNDFSDVIDPIPVEVWVGTNRIFIGHTDPENSGLNPDSETFSCECTSEDRSWLDSMKDLKLGDSPADVSRMFLEIFAEFDTGSSPANVEGRWFWSLKSLIENLTNPAIPVSFQISGVDLGQYFVGGRGFNLPVRLPNTTAAQLVKDTAALFNAMYYMDNGMLIIRDRKSFIDSSDTPLDLPVIRGSVRGTTRRCGLDKMKFAFANAESIQAVYENAGFDRYSIVRDSAAVSLPMTKDVKSSFFQANTEERIRSAQRQAFIPRSDSDNDSLYLVTNATAPSGYSGAGNIEVKPFDALSWYDCEFRGLMEWEATYSVMDNEAALAQLIMPLRTIVHPLGRKTINVIRSAKINLDNETVTVKGLEFRP